MANRTLLGKHQNGINFGLYVSKPGQNVLTASQPEHYLFNSDVAAGAVIHASGTLTLGATAAFAALPYVPLVMSWGVLKSNGQQAGRYLYFDGYYEQWWNPGLSEYESEYFSISHSGPILHSTTSTVSFPTVTIPGWTIPNNWNARYVVLRVPAS
ncbi:hypothetical protein D3C80_1281070 [compost metagenome]